MKKIFTFSVHVVLKLTFVFVGGSRQWRVSHHFYQKDCHISCIKIKIKVGVFIYFTFSKQASIEYLDFPNCSKPHVQQYYN